MSGPFEDNTRSAQVSQSQIVMADVDTNEAVSVQSVTQIWNTLTWAERTYYRAKYGFSEDGGFLPESIVNPIKAGFRVSVLHSGQVVLPVMGLPGSDERLREILSQSRIAVGSLRYTDGLAHTGPDGTVMLTDEYLWGLPDGRCDTEVSRSYSCIWEASPGNWAHEAPWWALASSTGDAPEL